MSTQTVCNWISHLIISFAISPVVIDYLISSQYFRVNSNVFEKHALWIIKLWPVKKTFDLMIDKEYAWHMSSLSERKITCK